MVAAKIFEIKNRLSAYLREVKNGHEVIILDRETPVAKIVPYSEKMSDFVIRPPRGNPKDLKKFKGMKTKKPIDILKVLNEIRRDRFDDLLS